MPEADDETRREIIRRLFYLITVAAEDALASAVEGQSRRSSLDHAKVAAATLLELGRKIEILSSTIPELIEDVGNGDETA